MIPSSATVSSRYKKNYARVFWSQSVPQISCVIDSVLSLRPSTMSMSLLDSGSQGYDEAADWTRETSVIKSAPSYQESSGSRRKLSPRQSIGKDEDDEEDCCCCPVDPVLCWFRFFHTISGCIGIATMAANIFVLVTVDSQTLNYKDIIMRSYAVIFCFIIVIAGKIIPNVSKPRRSCSTCYFSSWILSSGLVQPHIVVSYLIWSVRRNTWYRHVAYCVENFREQLTMTPLKTYGWVTLDWRWILHTLFVALTFPNTFHRNRLEIRDEENTNLGSVVLPRIFLFLRWVYYCTGRHYVLSASRYDRIGYDCYGCFLCSDGAYLWFYLILCVPPSRSFFLSISVYF